jgi:hypothetical protein
MQPSPIIPRALNLEQQPCDSKHRSFGSFELNGQIITYLVRQSFVHPLTAEEVAVPGSKVDVETRRQELVPIPFVKYS